ncbi:hypothetical protein AAFP35_23825 [Gordonia sp. CPCC 206044]|uniref:hypothetical protein n=1 Tax=Gordonia sp. CPCC 206044 TaxID=3140793 RepID=UPI003AF3BC22
MPEGQRRQTNPGPTTPRPHAETPRALFAGLLLLFAWYVAFMACGLLGVVLFSRGSPDLWDLGPALEVISGGIFFVVGTIGIIFGRYGIGRLAGITEAGDDARFDDAGDS